MFKNSDIGEYTKYQDGEDSETHHGLIMAAFDNYAVLYNRHQALYMLVETDGVSLPKVLLQISKASSQNQSDALMNVLEYYYRLVASKDSDPQTNTIQTPDIGQTVLVHGWYLEDDGSLTTTSSTMVVIAKCGDFAIVFDRAATVYRIVGPSTFNLEQLEPLGVSDQVDGSADFDYLYELLEEWKELEADAHE